MIPATLPLPQIDLPWDVIIVGAGPAGALAARECARRNMKTLLLDKASFPRPKICGSCLNQRVQYALRASEIHGMLEREHAAPLHELKLAAGNRVATIRLPQGYVSLSRERLDAALIKAAIEAGADFVPNARARLGDIVDDQRVVSIAIDGACVEIRAAIVLAADGIGGSLTGKTASATLSPHAHIGLGAIMASPPTDYARGLTYMACGAYGYVGLQRLEDDRLDIAGAVNPAWMRAHGGPARAVAAILGETRLPVIEGLERLDWKGTPPLTRTADVAKTPRVFSLGDAAGYVEPFTGEGIAWALESALAVAPVMERALRHYTTEIEAMWRQQYRHVITRRQWLCKAMAAGLRHPALVKPVVMALSRAPLLARPVIHEITRHPRNTSRC